MYVVVICVPCLLFRCYVLMRVHVVYVGQCVLYVCSMFVIVSRLLLPLFIVLRVCVVVVLCVLYVCAFPLLC